jgi:uncharacterized membrane protein
MKLNIIAISVLLCSFMSGLFIGGLATIPFNIVGGYNAVMTIIFFAGFLVGFGIGVKKMVEVSDEILPYIED